MKCSTCGLPLSPSRVACPRCGMPYSAGRRNVQPELEVLSTEMQEITAGASEAGMSPDQWRGNAGAAPWNRQGIPPQEGGGAGMEQPLFPGIESGYARPTNPGGMEAGAATSEWQGAPGRAIAAGSGAPLASRQPQYAWNAQEAGSQRRSRQATRVGLTAASACIITGALILIFVSIMAQGLASQTTTGQGNGGQQANVQPQVTPTPTIALSPTPSPTPTETFPGQAYIDNGRMASDVIESTGQVITYATDFQIGQKVYVTFTLHAEITTGAVCLSWYINNTYDNHYEFDVLKNVSYNAYSYAIFHQTGPGYVEIAWASSMACTNKQLAQRVTFTVTA